LEEFIIGIPAHQNTFFYFFFLNSTKKEPSDVNLQAAAPYPTLPQCPALILRDLGLTWTDSIILSSASCGYPELMKPF
jgi:hypothetical protein